MRWPFAAWFGLVSMIFFSAAVAAEDRSESLPEQRVFEMHRAAADEARKRASSVGGEWRDIGKLLRRADAAAKREEYALATTLARRAEFQAKMGYAQAMRQRGIGSPSYLRWP